MFFCLWERTWFAVANFFSVAMMPPLRCAAFRAALPRTTVSRCWAPGPRVLLPILVTDSQSSDMLSVGGFVLVGMIAGFGEL